MIYTGKTHSHKMEFVDPYVRIGCHIAKHTTLFESVYRTIFYPVNCAQIYLGSSRSYALPKVDEKDIRLTRAFVDFFVFRVYVHSCLLYNLNGSTHIDNIDELLKTTTSKTKLEKLKLEKTNSSSNLKKTIEGLIVEMNICYKAFGTGVVVHIGSGEIKDKAIKRISDTINTVLSRSEGTLLLENAAGEGNKIGSKLEEIRDILNQVKDKERVGICIDTCHLFAAGDYNISKISEIKRFFGDFDKMFGLDKLRLVHLNDSKGVCGCKVDRHEDLGKGFIFKDDNVLQYLVNFCNENKIDMILETPGAHDINVKKIYSVI